MKLRVFTRRRRTTTIAQPWSGVGEFAVTPPGFCCSLFRGLSSMVRKIPLLFILARLVLFASLPLDGVGGYGDLGHFFGWAFREELIERLGWYTTNFGDAA